MRIENGDLKQIIKDVLTGHFTSADIHIEGQAPLRAIDQLIIGGFAARSLTELRQAAKPAPCPKQSLASMIFAPPAIGGM